MRRRVSFSPEASICSQNDVADAKFGGNLKRAMLKIWIFKIPSGTRFSPASFFRYIGEKVVRPRKVSPSATLSRSRSYAETLDSHRAEAIEECIEFLNSCSSLQRSNSVSSSDRR